MEIAQCTFILGYTRTTNVITIFQDLVLESVAGISKAKAVLAHTRIALTKDNLAKAIESSTKGSYSSQIIFIGLLNFFKTMNL